MAGTRAAARDRRWVAVHEAGHVIAARHFGEQSAARIWLAGDHWEGATVIPTIDAMSNDQRRVIGLAGAAAVTLWVGVPADRFFSMNVGVSRSDWELIGCADTATLREALAVTLNLLKSERAALLITARQLTVESRANCRTPGCFAPWPRQ